MQKIKEGDQQAVLGCRISLSGHLELCIAHSLTLLAVMILILSSVHLRSLA